jgi:hypothetical protein
VRETVLGVRSREAAAHAANKFLSAEAVTAVERLLGVEAAWLPARIDLPEKFQVRGGERSVELFPTTFTFSRRGVASGEHLPAFVDRALELGAAMFPNRTRAAYRGEM